jgi:hypothetical protein
LVTDEGGGSPKGSVHGGVARPEGNNGEGRRPVVEVGSSRLRKVVRTQAVVGAARQWSVTAKHASVAEEWR